MKIHPVGAELFLADRDRHEVNSRSSQFFERLKKQHINEWMQDLVGEGKQLPLVGRLRMSGAAPLLPPTCLHGMNKGSFLKTVSGRYES